MSFSVTRSTQTLVTPAEPTPAATLPLSPFDSLPSLRHQIPVLLVFRHGGEAPSRTIRDALAKALVHYYPLAGRLVGEGENSSTLHVDCNNAGVRLAESSADCKLEDVNYLDHPWVIPLVEFFAVRDEDDDPLLLLQVTKFTCGGVAIGVEVNHAMMDGTGLGQFVVAVAELARGLDRPTIEPVWLRERIMSNPPKFSGTNQISVSSDLHLHHYTVDISMDYVNRVKCEYTKTTAQPCTIFDVSAASIWQGRTRAIDLDPDVDVELIFGCNARRLASDVLPAEGGYYGNFFYPVVVKARTGWISNASIVDVVKLVSDAKTQSRSDLEKSRTWRNGDFGEGSRKTKISYETLFLSDWARLGFGETDFGWGTPMRAFYVFDDPGMPFAVMNPMLSEDSKRAQTACVKEEHLKAFISEMMKLA